MTILIVESDPERAALWQEHIERAGMPTALARSQSDAVRALQTLDIGLIVLSLELGDGSPLAVADFAQYRTPELRVIVITSSGMFADGSIFMHAGNACAYLPASTPPADLAAMVEHYRKAA